MLVFQYPVFFVAQAAIIPAFFKTGKICGAGEQKTHVFKNGEDLSHRLENPILQNGEELAIKW